MKITAENYEPRALDYLEGTLSPSEREAFECFLAADPRATQQIRSLEAYMPVARAEKIAFPDPASLTRGRGVTSLRRLLSLVSGAAAAALVAGSFMLLERAADPTPTVAHRSPQSIVSPATETVIAEMLIAEPAHLPASPDNRSEAASPAAVSARNAAPGTSRLREWNRKTADLLRRMEARNDRHNEPAHRMVAATRPATGSETPPPVTPASGPETEGLLAAVSDPRHKAAFMTERAKERSRTTQDNLVTNGLSLLPADATTPILSPREESPYLHEEYPTSEYWLSDTPRPRREGGLLRSLLSPIEKISPIKYYETEEGRGVEIASILRIGSRNN